MEKALLYKFLKSFTVVAVFVGSQSTYADENINVSNCMLHLGGGGFGDFDCYEYHAKSLEVDNERVSNAIRLMRGVTSANKAELDGYRRTQDVAMKACNLAIKLEYPSQREKGKRSHVELYDVMAARCRYSIRKQQNDFLHDLYSITSG